MLLGNEPGSFLIVRARNCVRTIERLLYLQLSLTGWPKRMSHENALADQMNFHLFAKNARGVKEFLCGIFWPNLFFFVAGLDRHYINLKLRNSIFLNLKQGSQLC
jgi:hypothetical protein